MIDHERKILYSEKNPEEKDKIEKIFSDSAFESNELSKTLQNALEQTGDVDMSNNMDNPDFASLSGDYEDKILEDAEKSLSELENTALSNETKPSEPERKSDIKNETQNKHDGDNNLLEQINAQQKEIKNLSTAIEDLNLQIKDLISKEKIRQEDSKKLVEDIINACGQLKTETNRYIALADNIVDNTTEQLDMYYKSNWDRLNKLSSLAADKSEHIVKQVLEIGVRNINASLSEQKKFVKSMTLKFSFASWALTITGLFTPLFILYLIAMLKRWI